jgi:hypothetical protein
MPRDKMFGHLSFILILITVAVATFVIFGYILNGTDTADSESVFFAYGYSVDTPQDNVPAVGDSDLPPSPELPYATRPVKIEDNDWCKEGERIKVYTGKVTHGQQTLRTYLDYLIVRVGGLYLMRGEELCMAKIVPDTASGIEYNLFIFRGDYYLELLGRKKQESVFNEEFGARMDTEVYSDGAILRYIMNNNYEIVNVALPPDGTSIIY